MAFSHLLVRKETADQAAATLETEYVCGREVCLALRGSRIVA